MPKYLNKIIKIKDFEKIKIIRSLFAERCEICHKNDCFNPETNHCTRCANILKGINIKGNEFIYKIGNGIKEGSLISLVLSIIIVGPLFLLSLDRLSRADIKLLSLFSILNLIAGILNSYFGLKYLKLSTDESVLLFSKNVIDWFTCVFIAVGINGLVNGIIISVLFFKYVYYEINLIGFIIGIILGSLLGLYNGSINSIFLLKKRNQEIREYYNLK
jgi:hypothetical protein